MKQIVLLIGLIASLSFAQNVVQQNLNSNWKFKLSTNTTWYNADVPSTVHLDLLKNNLIPDPYYGSNIDNVQWIELSEWDYQLTFDVANSAILTRNHIDMIFDGLDTHADVSLNNVALFHAYNQHRKWQVDVKEHLLSKGNLLQIHFYSSAAYDKAAGDHAGNILPSNYSYSRKAAYQYGWDWGPRLVTAGIWKNVNLEGYNTKIDSALFRTKDISSTQAQMETWVNLQGDEGDYRVKITNLQDLMVVADQTVHFDNTSAAPFVFGYQIKNPILWWVRNLGQPYLYRFNVSVYKSGTLMDSKIYRTGIRTVKVVQQKDKTGNGTTFMVNLNGENVFMKGGNYIPPDMFMPRALKNPQVYNKTIQDAIDGNYNMIRIWGGGQFEYDVFYDLCDEAGLLIWHDFMFACAMYPGSQDYYDNIWHEIIDNVKRLRNHPSIALWNGNNEVYQGWMQWGWQDKLTPEQRQEVWEWYVEIFQKTIPGALAQVDPDRFYWETSPSTLIGKDLLLDFGDIHFYGVWSAAMDIEDYNMYVGRFNSEYGMQGMLPFQSIKKFTTDKDWNFFSYVMLLHERHPNGTFLVQYYVEKYFGVTVAKTSFEKYIYLTQVMQSYAIQTAIEATRRNKSWCMGSLYWQLNDVWPVTSWASVDFYHEWKALHYTVRHMFKNYMISVYPVKAKDGTQFMGIYLVNDNIRAIQGQLTILLNTFTNESPYTIQQNIIIDGSSSANVYNITMNMYNHYDPKRSFMKTTFTPVGSSESYSHIHFMNFTRPVNQKLPNPSYSLSFDLKSNTITVFATTFVKSLYFYIKDYTGSIKLSDNYFDMIPGEIKQIQLLEGSLADLQSNIKTMSLFEALKSASYTEQMLQAETI